MRTTIVSRAPCLPLIGLLVACGLPHLAAQEPAAPTLWTRWAAEAAAAPIPLPEHPRPQLRRERWINLNGPWDLAITDSGASSPESYRERILVPFPVESQLSGVRRAVLPAERVWYRRMFERPEGRAGERWLLHFGAVDWEARVWVNGRLAGEHRGGYDPFTFDVTDHLRPAGPQEIVVSVWDPTDEGNQPRGKQVLRPHGIWYTAVTGIWQTVWLEPVPATYVSGLRFVPDAAAGTVTVIADVAGAAADERVDVAIEARGRTVATARGRPGEPIAVKLPKPRLWSPDDPFLYDVGVRLSSGDTVRSYVGLRSIAIAPDAAGYRRFALNGQPVFQFGLLDQGWWPDGLYTPPTDAALASDIEVTKRLGFNTIRKHVKVEPARWYYHADRLGVLVWQDMPSGDNETPASRAAFAGELERVVTALVNHPSIVMWVPFNEGWGQHATDTTVAAIRALDATRLVNNASGWTDKGVGDVHDVHHYPGPGMPEPAPGRAAVLGEFGGLGLPLAGHTWVDEGNWGYRGFGNRDSLVAAYRGLLTRLRPLIGEGLAAAIYTQTTDVEVEVNGIMTYDRAVVKLPDGIAANHARLYARPPEVATVVPTSRDQAQMWQYRMSTPSAGWQAGTDGTAGWSEGPGGFGTDSTPGARVGTPWNTPEIWIRRTFRFEGANRWRLWLRIHHDEDAEVWINGERAAALPGYTTGYVLVPTEPAGRAALRDGENVLAIHVRQTRGGQYVDAGLVEVRERDGGSR
jgi:Glycosyl hydrolases family 2, sugar binding domain/Glycosyl hydrolases family 2, TIM barrel domain/Glycosyl hydrolases family 2